MRIVRPALLALLLTVPAFAASSFAERIRDEKYLQSVRKDAKQLGKAAQPQEKSGDLLDVRCILHAHSSLSHDSRGTQAEILAAAKAVGARAVFMTEHPTADRKWLTSGLQGEKDGVLFVPGAELSDGLLIWRGAESNWAPGDKAGEVLRKLEGTDGVAFIAHPEQRKEEADWELPRFAGMEIYNTHADAMDSGYEKVLESIRTENPLKILQMLNTVKKYQQEAFTTFFDEQVGTLKRWDSLNSKFFAEGRRVVGISGNDSHKNVGVSFEIGEQVVIKDGLGKVVGMVPATNIPIFLLGGLAANPDNLKYTFDPYEVSFKYVSTHVLAPEVSRDVLLDSLQRGRAYVAFDWMADPSGFRFSAAAGDATAEMGADIPLSEGLKLTAKPNMPCEIRLLRNGEAVHQAEGAELTFEPKEPGVYRAECWVTVAGEKRPWIYTNPIYVVAPP
jgi:hypothetical protein